VAAVPPKEFALDVGFPGIGGHISVSLRDRESGRNVFADPTAEHGLSSMARSFLAGVIDTVPEAFAMLAHTVNAYRRLAPGSWAPKTVSWATYNYAAALRTAGIWRRVDLRRILQRQS
jgi:glutamine synthetase